MAPPPPPLRSPDAHGAGSGAGRSQRAPRPAPRQQALDTCPLLEPPSGRRRHPEAEVSELTSRYRKHSQPRRFRAASVPVPPTVLAKARKQQSSYPALGCPRHSRRGLARRVPHTERRRQLWRRSRMGGGGEEGGTEAKAANQCRACWGREQPNGRVHCCAAGLAVAGGGSGEEGDGVAAIVVGTGAAGWWRQAGPGPAPGLARQRGFPTPVSSLVGRCRVREQGRKPCRVCACGGASRCFPPHRRRSAGCGAPRSASPPPAFPRRRRLPGHRGGWGGAAPRPALM